MPAFAGMTNSDTAPRRGREKVGFPDGNWLEFVFASLTSFLFPPGRVGKGEGAGKSKAEVKDGEAGNSDD